MHDWRDSVEKGKSIFAGQRTNSLGQRRRGERPAGNYYAVPLSRRLANFLAVNFNEWIAFKSGGDCRCESVAIDGECASGRQFVRVGGLHHQRTEVAHLGVQKADGAAVRVVGTE